MLPFAQAQEGINSVVPVIAGGAGQSGRMYVGGAGDYRQVEVNVTELAKSALATAQVTQEVDRQYVLSAVQSIHEAYVDLAQSTISTDLLELQSIGLSGDAVSIDQFLKATNGVKLKMVNFKSLLEKSRSINKSTLPSNYVVNSNEDEGQQVVPSVGKVNLDDVVNTYNKMIESEILPQLAQYRNIKVEINGEILSLASYKSLLNPDFSSVPQLSPEKRAEVASNITNLRKKSQQIGEKERINFADALRDGYNSFARTYGADYKYIFRSDSQEKEDSSGVFGKIGKLLFGSGESKTKTGKGDTVQVNGIEIKDDMTQRNEAFNRMVEVFWMRSYLRLTQGIQICAVQPKEVKTTNFGALKDIDPMKNLRTGMACSRTELEEALENARRVLTYTGVQADHIFNGEGLMETGVINKIGSAVTFFKGNRPSAEALNMLMQLVFADIQEELIMATPGKGLSALRDLYSARYQSSPELKAHYSSLKCSIDFDSQVCGDVGAFDVDDSVGMEQDVKSIFKDLQTRLKVAKDYIDQANRLEQSLEMARSDSESAGRAKDRKKDL